MLKDDPTAGAFWDDPSAGTLPQDDPTTDLCCTGVIIYT